MKRFEDDLFCFAVINNPSIHLKHIRSRPPSSYLYFLEEEEIIERKAPAKGRLLNLLYSKAVHKMTNTYFVKVLTKHAVSEGTVIGSLPYYSGMIDPVVMIALRCQDTRPHPDTAQEIAVDLENRDNHMSDDWLLHVHSARSEEEQNVELMTNNGKLYCVAKKKIKPKTELLIWYSEELLNVLGAKDPSVISVQSSKNESYCCKYCEEKFTHRNPHVAHVLFRCERRHLAVLRDLPRFHMKWADMRKNIPVEIESQPEILTQDTYLNSRKRENIRLERTGSSVVNPVLTSGMKRKISDKTDEKIVKKSRESFSPKETPSDNKVTSEDKVNVNERTFSAFRRVENTIKSRQITDIVKKSLGSKSLSVEELTRKDSGERSEKLSANKKSSPPSPGSQANYCGVAPSTPMPGLFGRPQNLATPAIDVIPRGTPQNNNTPNFVLGDDKPPEMMSQLTLMERNKILFSNCLQDNAMLPRSIAAYPASRTHAPSNIPGVMPPMLPMPQIGAVMPTPMAPAAFMNENWCAKCNASFRMTSDLVYHMRTHHKREIDGSRKKRDEKLKCHICSESFRERHHLTRHMTSHM